MPPLDHAAAIEKVIGTAWHVGIKHPRHPAEYVRKVRHETALGAIAAVLHEFSIDTNLNLGAITDVRLGRVETHADAEEVEGAPA